MTAAAAGVRGADEAAASHAAVTLLGTARLWEPAAGFFREALGGYVAASRREPGCLGFDAYLGAADPLEVAFVERWRDGAALLAHLGAPHTEAFLLRAAPCLVAPPEYATLDAG